MIETIQRWLNTLQVPQARLALQPVMFALGDRLSSQCLTSAGLAIKGAGLLLVKAGSAFYGTANGVFVSKAADTDMAALSGTVVNATFNVYAFFIDSAGVLTSAMGTAGATWGTVIFPPLPEKKALIGFVRINPTGTGNFVGGTTALDDATVAPNAVYINCVGPWDPTVIIN